MVFRALMVSGIVFSVGERSPSGRWHDLKIGLEIESDGLDNRAPRNAWEAWKQG